MNNTEEKFYECFRIRKKCCFVEEQGHECGHDCCICDNPKFPPITDRILLKLICIVSGIYPVTINCREDIDELKSFILRFCIRHKDEFDTVNIRQVQALFEEE